MANIGSRPTAADLLARSERRDRYGDHAFYEHDGTTVTLRDNHNHTLALATLSMAEVEPFFDQLYGNPKLVPYVNAFVAHTNQRVEKYWRTRLYHLVPIDKDRPMGAPDPALVTTGPVANGTLDALRTAQMPTEIPFHEYLRGLAIILYRASETERDRATVLPRLLESGEQSSLDNGIAQAVAVSTKPKRARAGKASA